jgi:hypothetical protein
MEWSPDQLKTVFPNTQPGSEHGGLEFACYYCGELAVESDDIHEIKRGAVWTNKIPDGIEQKGKKLFNKYKKCNFYSAVCKTCGNSVGSVYKESFEDCDENQEFPCVKVTYIRQSKDGSLMNATALNIPQDEIIEVVSALTLSDDQGGVTRDGCRLNARNFDKYR